MGTKTQNVLKKPLKMSCLLFSFLVLLFFSCAGNPNVYREIDSAVYRDDFEKGIDVIVKAQEGSNPIYQKNNSISLYLDKGLLEHYTGKYSDSSKNLQEAERLIEEAFTKSISADIASYIANDNVKEYPGEDYEDIYINVFNALNYYNQGNLEGAMVEIRKINMSSGKLDMLSRKYENNLPSVANWLVDQFRNIGLAINPELPRGKGVDFSNSALARYLGALFYLGNGDRDDARIEFEQLHAAYTGNLNIYGNPLPSSVSEIMDVPAGKARLNIIAFAGLSPIKVEGSYPYLFPFFRNAVLRVPVFKLPKFVKRISSINRIEVIIDNKTAFFLELLEDMGAVIEETYNARFSNLFFKTYIRLVLKYAIADIAAVRAGEKGSSKDAFFSASIAKMLIDASESADIRMSRYLPDKAYIGGVNLEPGTYAVTVNYYSGNKVIARDERMNVPVRAGVLNLLETVNLK